jgi:cysteine dioxygenase
MSAKITTVKALIKALEMCVGERCVLDIMKAVDIPINEFEQYYYWNDEHYTRNLLARTENYEVLLVCWEKGQQSPIHDFDSSEAWIHPLAGKLKEERFVKREGTKELDKVSSVILGKDEFSYMSEVGMHRYSNVYEMRSVSLNIYSKPVDQWRVYDEATGEEVYRPAKYDKHHELTGSNTQNA